MILEEKKEEKRGLFIGIPGDEIERGSTEGSKVILQQGTELVQGHSAAAAKVSTIDWMSAGAMASCCDRNERRRMQLGQKGLEMKIYCSGLLCIQGKSSSCIQSSETQVM